jgi:hypothetical protein
VISFAWLTGSRFGEGVLLAAVRAPFWRCLFAARRFKSGAGLAWAYSATHLPWRCQRSGATQCGRGPLPPIGVTPNAAVLINHCTGNRPFKGPPVGRPALPAYCCP